VLSDILDENPSNQIAVFVVWFAVLGPDAPSEVVTSLLADERTVHYWDSDGEVSDFLSQHADQIGLPGVKLLWDAYLLFPPGAFWEEFPSPLAGWGAPVVSSVDELTAELDDMWKDN
jgi:hypothetical protein